MQASRSMGMEWNVLANINNNFVLFSTHSFTNSTLNISLGCLEKNGSDIFSWSSVGAHITGYAINPKGQAEDKTVDKIIYLQFHEFTNHPILWTKKSVDC